jgi:hypothetical protein
MIVIAMMAGSLTLAQYGYGSPPPSGAYQNDGGQPLNVAPYVQLERKCFETALAATSGAAPDERQKRYDACVALHNPMITHATARLTAKEAASAKRDLDLALRGVETNYAKRLGIAVPNGAK